MSLTNVNIFSKYVIREIFVRNIRLWIGRCKICRAMVLNLL
jgi:hypothetical protein